MFFIAFLGELGIQLISVSNHRKKKFESDVGSVLKEFETFIFYENLPKTLGETHFRSFESYLLYLLL